MAWGLCVEGVQPAEQEASEWCGGLRSRADLGVTCQTDPETGSRSKASHA